MRIVFSTLIAVTLLGCSHSSYFQLQPSAVVASVQGDTNRVFWLDKSEGAQTLIEKANLGTQGEYQARYRWYKGEVRDVLIEGKVMVDGALQPEWLEIRYHNQGQAVYQQYKVAGKLRPMRQAELTHYYEQAKTAFNIASSLEKEKSNLIQGHVNKGVFMPCGTKTAATLVLPSPLASKWAQRTQHDYFIAATGSASATANTVHEIIAIDDSKQQCIAAPSFAEQSDSA